MSGHNKWSKIKRKKEVADAEKSKVFSKYASLIAVESRKAKGNLASPGLAAVIERAKKDHMPKENIDRAVQKGAGAEGSSLSEVLYETYGPGGVAILITAVTDNPNRTTPEIRHTLSKQGYALGAAGSALWAFQKTGDGYVPTAPIALSDADGEKLANLVEALEENDDVQDIYTTADEAELPE
ncbi:MAG TPA: YebC/PmpR family DNA-binding transcriptional regulator [Candidatus Paceibacterota bacterium]|nr:YebC/PmpR family DNA-binding transcriptional regulator [Candidatus Paceibacterota bacterium]